MYFWLVVAFIYGIFIGSFLNVVIWRVPRGGSIASPVWSYCPQCEHRLGAVDLIPIFSFAFLRARCRYCSSSISWRYPAIELLTGLLFTGAVWLSAPNLVDAIFNCLFVSVMVCVFFIDLEHFIIPDELNFAAVFLGLAHNAFGIGMGRPGQWSHPFGLSVPASLWGAIVYAGVMYAIAFLSYVYIVALLDKSRTVPAAMAYYARGVLEDWRYLAVYFLSWIIPPLRRHIEPPPPMEGTTAEEIEGDDDGGGVGDGDAKLAAGIGAFLGWKLGLLSFFMGIFVGAAAGMFVLIAKRRSLGSRTAMPFGPALVVGALAAMCIGNPLITWYVTTYLTPPATSAVSMGGLVVPWLR